MRNPGRLKPENPVLSDDERRFIAAYLDGNRNAARAWRAAFGTEGSPDADSRKGRAVVNRPHVQAALARVEERNEARTCALIERYAISEQRILEELASMAFASSLDVMRIQKDGTAVIDLSRLDKREAAAIAEVTVDEYMEGRGPDARAVKRVKVKLSDKLRALNMLGQRLGLWKRALDAAGEDGKVKVDGGGLSALLEEAARLATAAAAEETAESGETVNGPGRGDDGGA